MEKKKFYNLELTRKLLKYLKTGPSKQLKILFEPEPPEKSIFSDPKLMHELSKYFAKFPNSKKSKTTSTPDSSNKIKINNKK